MGIDNLVDHASHPPLPEAPGFLPGRWGRQGGRLRALLILMMSVDPPDVIRNMTKNLDGEDYGQDGSCARDTCRLIGLSTLCGGSQAANTPSLSCLSTAGTK